eukprot:COSAG02_NODE_6216_length_3719_cov_131.992541_1_plen_511_part_00
MGSKDPGGVTVFQNPLEDNSAVFEPNTSRAGGGVARADRPMDSDMLAEEEEYGDALGVMTIAKFGVSLGLNVTKGTLGTLGTLTPGLAAGGSPRTQSASREELRKLFDRLDVDGGGTLDPPELRELIHGLGVHLTEAELAATVLEMISSVRCIISDSTLSTDCAFSAPNTPACLPLPMLQSGKTVDVTEQQGDLEVTFEQFADWWLAQLQADGDSADASKLARILRGFDVDVSPEENSLKRLTYFDPAQMFKRAWDSYVIMVLLYVGVTLPYRIAFEASVHDVYYVIAVVYELSLIADVAINLRTAYWDEENGELVTDTWSMIKNYLWFRVGWMDVVSSFPFQTMKFDTNANVSGNMKLLQMLRLCQVTRIAKVIRAIKALQHAFYKLVNDTLGRLTVSVSVYTMRMTKLCTLLITSAHLCACIWCVHFESITLNAYTSIEKLPQLSVCFPSASNCSTFGNTAEHVELIVVALQVYRGQACPRANRPGDRRGLDGRRRRVGDAMLPRRCG